jgi:hypothetical protein
MGPGADGADVDRRMDNETLALACAKGGDLGEAALETVEIGRDHQATLRH